MKLMAGAAIVDITPPKGMELGGYPHYPRRNTGVHDPLYASCMYFDDGEHKLALVALDILFFSKRHVEAVRARIEAETGIPAPNVMISCTHTHSGPWASGRLDLDSLRNGVAQDSTYVESLKAKIVGAVAEAVSTRFESKVGVGKGRCGKEQGVGGNRREVDGPSDPEVGLLAIADARGICRAVMVNYTLHPTVIHAESTVVTADYPGYIREYLARRMPGAVVLFTQGTSGDQSSRYFRKGQSFEEAKRIGFAIGEAAYSRLKTMDYRSEARLCARSEEIDIGLRDLPPKKEVLAAIEAQKRLLEELKRGGADYIAVQNADLKLLGYEDVLGYIEMREQGRRIDLYEDEREAEIQAIAIGDARIAAIPGEVFVEFGLDIKRRSPLPGTTFVVELANGCLPGYACTRQAYAEGGYEAGTSLLAEDFGYEMVEKAVELMGGSR